MHLFTLRELIGWKPSKKPVLGSLPWNRLTSSLVKSVLVTSGFSLKPGVRLSSIHDRLPLCNVCPCPSVNTFTLVKLNLHHLSLRISQFYWQLLIIILICSNDCMTSQVWLSLIGGPHFKAPPISSSHCVYPVVIS